MQYLFKYTLITILSVFITSTLFIPKANAQSETISFEKVISNPIIQKAKNKNFGILIAETAKSLIDKPYIGGKLDKQYKDDKFAIEKLEYDFEGFDCVTLCETAYAIAKTIKAQEIKLNQFEKYLENIRYHNGRIKNYASRLHYTSEWIIDNELRGNIKDISKKIKAKKFTSKVNFMSQNYKLYPALVNDTSLIQQIFANETLINRTDRYYIPTSDIPKYIKNINTGDFIAIATNKKGLDYAHIGIAYFTPDNKLHLLHASTKQKKVILDDELISYLAKNKSMIGISVLRPQ